MMQFPVVVDLTIRGLQPFRIFRHRLIAGLIAQAMIIIETKTRRRCLIGVDKKIAILVDDIFLRHTDRCADIGKQGFAIDSEDHKPPHPFLVLIHGNCNSEERSQRCLGLFQFGLQADL